MKVIGIVQARSGSKRLPKKVLLELAGRSMLGRVIERLERSHSLSDIVVATTTLPEDGEIADLCQTHRWRVFRGSEVDVLDRYYRAAVAFGAEAVVRITSDCPLIDSGIVDSVVDAFLERQPGLACASNVSPLRSFPRGLDAEVIRFDALERAWLEDKNLAWREHVTLYIHRHPELFPTYCLINSEDYSHLRWTVDTREDLAFAATIYNHFGDTAFKWSDVLHVLEQRPDWTLLNKHIEQKVV